MQAAPVEPEVLGARLRQQQLIDDPQHGERAPLVLEGDSVLWPHPSQWALIELLQVTESGARRLEEYRFTPARALPGLPAFQGPGLPVALVFERTPNGASRARLYSVPALRAHHPRSLMVDGHLAPGRDAADVLTRVSASLRAGDVEATLECFESEATLQESDGSIRHGAPALRAALARRLRDGAGAVRLCARLDEGARTALEVQLPGERAALGVCERSPSGLLSAVRLYG